MRLDKFLKVSRIIKRRTLAQDAAKAGHITVNGRVAKPATEVAVGDIITIAYAKKTWEVEVLSIKPSIHKSDASDMYQIITERAVA